MLRSSWLTKLLSLARNLDTAISTCVIGMLMMASFCAPAANADTMYSYTGNDFTFANGPYTTSDMVTGHLSFASALGSDLNGVSVSPTACGLSDGVNSMTCATPGVSLGLQISTNGTGVIDGWDFELQVFHSMDIFTDNVTGRFPTVKDQGSILNSFNNVVSDGSVSVVR